MPPLTSHTRKGPEHRAWKPQFRQKRKRLRSPAGPRRLGTATRISASLSRRLSAFFESTSRPRPKSGKVCRSDTRAGCQNGVLCRFGILAGRCSRRTQKAFGTAMRLCVSLSRRRRGPAGPRCSVCNLVMLLFFHSARRAFRTCERGGAITTLGVLCVLLKRRTTACQKSSFAAF